MSNRVLLVSTLLSVIRATVMQIKQLSVGADSTALLKDVRSLKVPCKYIRTLSVYDFYLPIACSVANMKGFFFFFY